MSPPPPPPPPPPPGGPPGLGGAPKMPSVTPDRNALLGDIRKGSRLKKATTNDRSKPVVGGNSVSSAPPMGIGMGLPPSIPSLKSSNIDSDSNGNPSSAPIPPSAPMVPQLGDIFAGGMPKLKHISNKNSETTSSASAPPIPISPNLPNSRPKGRPSPITPSIPKFNTHSNFSSITSAAPPIPTGAPPIPNTSVLSIPKNDKSSLSSAFSHKRSDSSNSIVSSKSRPKVPKKKVQGKTPSIPTSPHPPHPYRTAMSSSTPIPSIPSIPSFGAPPLPQSPPIPSIPPPPPALSAPSIPPPPTVTAPSTSSFSAHQPPPQPSIGTKSSMKLNSKKPAVVAPTSTGLPFLAEIQNKRDDRFVVDSSPLSSGSASSISKLSTPSVPKMHNSSPPLLPSAPPPPPFGSAPAIPHSFVPNIPKAPSLPSMTAPSVPTASPPPSSFGNSSSAAPPAPPAPPPPPSFGNSSSAAPPAPPPPPSFGNKVSPKKLSSTAVQAPVPSTGGLPFLAEINKRRNDAFVIDESDVAKKGSTPVGAPSEQDNPTLLSASKASSAPAPSISSGNPLMDEIMNRRQNKSSNFTSAAPPVPSLPVNGAPKLPSAAPPAPSTPSALGRSGMGQSKPQSFSSTFSAPPASLAPPAPSAINDSLISSVSSIPPAFGMPGMTPPSIPEFSSSASTDSYTSETYSAPSAPPPPPSFGIPGVESKQSQSVSYPVPPTPVDNNINDDQSIYSASTSRVSSMSRKKPPPPPPSTTSSFPEPQTSTMSNSTVVTGLDTSRTSSNHEDMHIGRFGSIKHKLFQFGHHNNNLGKPNDDKIISQQVVGSNLRKIDMSTYTISGSMGSTGVAKSNNDTLVTMNDSRFRFLNQNELPKPHKFEGRIKLYPSGRGSSVPLNLSLYD